MPSGCTIFMNLRGHKLSGDYGGEMIGQVVFFLSKRVRVRETKQSPEREKEGGREGARASKRSAV